MTSTVGIMTNAEQPQDATESHVVAPRDPGAESIGFLFDEPPTPPPLDALRLQPGDAFAGLQVGQTLGVGGMATVYRAASPDQGQDVALKVLDGRLRRRDRHLARFRREAGLASRLRHPRIVSVLTYGEERGHAYITMPLIAGPTLAEAVERDGPLAPDHAARVVEQTARAIDAAHRQRVVHRDLKPSNVMLHPEDGPLVLDFGLAKDLSSDPTLTDTGEILGTPAFLAPEQVTPGTHPVDHRIDIYGLGGLLFFALTGRPLHKGQSSVEVLRHLLRHDPPRLREVDPDLPRPLEIIVAKALARDPRDRYQTAADLADDLVRFQGDAGIHARLPGPVQRLHRRIQDQPILAAGVVALLGALVVGGLLAKGLIERLALRQRSQQALEMLARAQDHAAEGRHAVADQTFLQAMLVAKGAYVADPEDPNLRDALARIKRSRMVYAEGRGNWTLAQELRLNLARLEGRPLPAAGSAAPTATITVHELRVGERVEFHRLDAPATIRAASPERPEAELAPGTYLALHHDRQGARAGAHLVVVDPGSRHTLHVGQEASPPPGVFTLPADALLDRLSR